MSNQSQELSEQEKLKKLFSYWRVHNSDHVRDIIHRLNLAQKTGYNEVADELAKVIELYQKINRHIESAGEMLLHHDSSSSAHRRIDQVANDRNQPESREPETRCAEVTFKEIGVIETPYTDQAPNQPVETDANYGWLDDLEEQNHLMLHIKGIPHDS